MALEDLPDPPSPPDAPRHVRLHPHQWIGLALLAVLPILALMGLFGETWETEVARGRGLDVVVGYPDRYRYKQVNSLEVELRSTSGQPLDTLAVALDTAFVRRFSGVSANPPFIRPFVSHVTDLEPGESRLVVIELQGERYGRHEGVLTVSGPDTIRVPLSILILP